MGAGFTALNVPSLGGWAAKLGAPTATAQRRAILIGNFHDCQPEMSLSPNLLGYLPIFT
jgi:hypothetical protein